jgi:hypothetical protein
VEFTSPDAEAKPVLQESCESSVPGLYVIGATTGRDLIKPAINQGFEVVERILGRTVEPADEQVLRARLPFWEGSSPVRRRVWAPRPSPCARSSSRSSLTPIATARPSCARTITPTACR